MRRIQDQATGGGRNSLRAEQLQPEGSRQERQDGGRKARTSTPKASFSESSPAAASLVQKPTDIPLDCGFSGAYGPGLRGPDSPPPTMPLGHMSARSPYGSTTSRRSESGAVSLPWASSSCCSCSARAQVWAAALYLPAGLSVLPLFPSSLPPFSSDFPPSRFLLPLSPHLSHSRPASYTPIFHGNDDYQLKDSVA